MITIIGLGTLGSRVAKKLTKDYELLLVDRDIVEEDNLKAQPTYTKKDLGIPKAIVTGKKFENKFLVLHVTEENIQEIGTPKLVIDCVDNNATRTVIDEYCKENNIPWVHGAAEQDLGEVLGVPKKSSVFTKYIAKKEDSEGCTSDSIELSTADKVAETQCKIAKELLDSNYELRLIRIKGEKPIEILVQEPEETITIIPHAEKACGKNLWHLTRINFDLEKIKKENKIESESEFHVTIKEGTFFKDKRALIKAKTEKEAIKKLKKILLSKRK